MKTKYLYINTIGCQMNVYDSESIARILLPLNYKETVSLEKADLIVVNTCAIREKAEQKVFSFLGRLSKLKRKKKGLIIAVGGCVAQQEGKKILTRTPFVDLVFGTQSINRLPFLIKTVETKKEKIVDIELSEYMDEKKNYNYKNDGKTTAFVTIMRGCDNYCTYCVVPYVRGREISRKSEDIINEIKSLVDSGVKEITLLGQNVNSYGEQHGLSSFSELLSRVNDIKGLLRIRFTTSHPKDISDDLVLCFKNLSKLCKHMHLPAQSGSNRILRKMNRKYSKEEYIEKIDKLRGACPDIAITSDFIVGFPRETRADYTETLDLIKRVEYDNIFAFKYSDRPNAAASAFLNKVSEDEKKERLKDLLNLQQHYTALKNQNYIGRTEAILVEGPSKKQDKSIAEWTGRTSTNRIVNFVCDKNILANEISVNKLINVIIEKSFSNSLWGRVVFNNQKAFCHKGEKNYAA